MSTKTCPCGIKFTRNGLKKYHSPACEIKYKSGRVEPGNELSMDLPVIRSIAIGTFQSYIREKYKGCGCYTCGTKTGLFHGGHFFKKELFSGMIFSEASTKIQCDYCNVCLDGNLKVFEEKLKAELGIVKFIELENESITTKNYRWSKLEFIEKTSLYRDKINILTK